MTGLSVLAVAGNSPSLSYLLCLAVIRSSESRECLLASAQTAALSPSQADWGNAARLHTGSLFLWLPLFLSLFSLYNGSGSGCVEQPERECLNTPHTHRHVPETGLRCDLTLPLSYRLIIDSSTLWLCVRSFYSAFPLCKICSVCSWS